MSAVFVISGQQRATSTPAQTSLGATAALVLAANHRRRGLIIQNTGLTIIKFNLGAATPTQDIYQIALKACDIANDGTGATYLDDWWQGDVTAISSAASGTMVITEILDGIS
jgi:hypothetical protein